MDQSNFQLLVGSQVRLHRKAQGFSQEKLAELADVHPTYISNIERGKVSASAYGYYRIALALGLKLDELFCLLDERVDVDFENDLVIITGKIRQMNEVQRGLYLAAIKGMLLK
jgi:transcriptional regulator with XRE-family HTH domain